MDPKLGGLSEEIWGRLRDEFRADAQDRLDTLEAALESSLAGSNGAAGDEALLVMRRETHNIKGMGGSFGFPGVSLIAHRLEDYLADVASLSQRNFRDVQVFLDSLRDIVGSGVEPSHDAIGALLRTLPAHSQPHAIEVTLRDVEVLLIGPSSSVRHIVARELRACGYRVTTARTPWEAFEIAVCARPDLIITSVVMDQVDGIDLARAFATMAITQQVPVAMLTSFAPDHPDFRRLPRDAAIIRLGQHLSDDLAAVLTGFDVG